MRAFGVRRTVSHVAQRRLVVAGALLVTSGAGAGLAANASAPATGAGVCVNPGPLCAPYDTAKAETAAALAEAAFACTAFTDVPCATIDGAGQTVYNDVFFPYAVCGHVNGTDFCIGPIE